MPKGKGDVGETMNVLRRSSSLLCYALTLAVGCCLLIAQSRFANAQELPRVLVLVAEKNLEEDGRFVES